MEKAFLLSVVIAGLFGINSCSLFEDVTGPLEVRWGIVEEDGVPATGNMNIYLSSFYQLYDTFDSACKEEDNYINISSSSCILNDVNKKDVKKIMQRIKSTAEERIPSNYKISPSFTYHTFRCEYKFGDGSWETVFERAF